MEQIYTLHRVCIERVLCLVWRRSNR